MEASLRRLESVLRDLRIGVGVTGVKGAPNPSKGTRKQSVQSPIQRGGGKTLDPLSKKTDHEMVKIYLKQIKDAGNDLFARFYKGPLQVDPEPLEKIKQYSELGTLLSAIKKGLALQGESSLTYRNEDCDFDPGFHEGDANYIIQCMESILNTISKLDKLAETYVEMQYSETLIQTFPLEFADGEHWEGMDEYNKKWLAAWCQDRLHHDVMSRLAHKDK